MLAEEVDMGKYFFVLSPSLFCVKLYKFMGKILKDKNWYLKFCINIEIFMQNL